MKIKEKEFKMKEILQQSNDHKRLAYNALGKLKEKYGHIFTYDIDVFNNHYISKPPDTISISVRYPKEGNACFMVVKQLKLRTQFKGFEKIAKQISKELYKRVEDRLPENEKVKEDKE